MFELPAKNCSKCDRLCDFRKQNQQKFPSYYNGPVDSFGDLSARILVVGLAPGLNGANQTNRPFTGDYAGDILYPCLEKFGLAHGLYQRRKDDGFELSNVRVTNAVRCVPPQNQVTTNEIKNCRAFLKEEIESMPNLKVILALGQVAHNAVLGALGYKLSMFKFKHGEMHQLFSQNVVLVDSYHTSRYNINTGVLTSEMFDRIVIQVKGLL